MSLYRITEKKMVSGVCAGLAHKFNTDVSIVRLAAVFLTVATGFGPGIVTYIVAAIIIPDIKDNVQQGQPPGPPA